MAWPNPVFQGQAILASTMNGIISDLSAMVNLVAGQAVYSVPASFTGAVSFAVAPTFTDAATTRTNLGVPGLATANSFGAANTFSGSITFNGGVNFGGSSSASSPLILRPTNYTANGAFWAYALSTVPASDNILLGQSGAAYSPSGLIGWVGNSNAFLYFNSGQDFKIGAGTGLTPALTIKGGTRNIILGGASDNGSDMLQVNGSVTVNGLTVVTPANITLGSGWLTWTPGVSAWLSMTVSGLTILDAQYLRVGPICYFKINITMTLGGTASNQIFITAPIPVVGNLSFVPGVAKHGGSLWQSAWGFMDIGGNLLKVLLPNEGNFALGSAAAFLCGSYRCA